MAEDPQEKLRATLVRAAREVERLRGRLAEVEAAATEPIAAIGAGLRLPGDIHDLDGLWQLLASGGDAIGVVPRSRWDADRYYDPNPDAPGKSYTREGAFLADVDRFDAGFFNISPREAATIDPQHRLLLETAWQALEHAGIVPATLVDSRTGVFVGFGPSDYAVLQERVGMNDAYEVMGTQMSFSAGRVAFHLGLQGPAFPVATACSSSFVALHLACQSLRSGESSLALVGGVQVMAAPETFVHLSRTRAIAPDGRCKTFSANADGYGRGEGAVTLVLERLSLAKANRRQILAVIRGSAVNHDGASSGIMAPNGTSQQKVLAAALSNAGLDPSDIDFVECNGTGTKLGDLVEIQALAAVYGKGRPAGRPLYIGAIKTNIGHLEPASGLAGIAKIIVAMQHRALPGTLHTRPRNPHVEWDQLPIEVVDELRPWSRRSDGVPLRAAVSAFGMSGTNTHVVIEEPPALEPRDVVEAFPLAPVPLVLSARDEVALREQATRLRRHLEVIGDDPLHHLAFSLATSRTHFKHRACVVARSRAELDAALGALGSAADHPLVVDGRAKVGGKVVFVMSGRLVQWPWAARLLEHSPAFRESIDACARALDPHTGWSLHAALRAPSSCSDDVVEIVGFATRTGLAAIWRGLGVTPDAVIGPSAGDPTAACIAGKLTLDEAAKAMIRGLASQSISRQDNDFASAIDGWIASGHRFFLAIDPPGVPFDPLREIFGHRDESSTVAFLGLSRGDVDLLDQFYFSLGKLHCLGYVVDWSAVFARHAPRRVPLPTYAFQRRRYWIETAEAEPAEVRAEDDEPSAVPLFERAWQPIPTSVASVVGSRWVIFADHRGVAAQLQAELTERGAVAELVIDVGPHDRSAIAATLDTKLRGPALTGIVCLWSIDAEDVADAGSAWLGGLHLARRLATLSLRDPPRLVLVSHLAHAHANSIPRPEQSLIWAIGASIRSELPLLTPVRVDLGEVENRVEIAALAETCVAGADEDQVLVRGSARWGARLRRTNMAAARGSLERNATYLITGSVEPALLSWMVESGAGHILVLERPSQDLLATLERAGAQIRVEPIDIGDASALASVIGEIPSERPLRGVIHGVGELPNGSLDDQTPAEFQSLVMPAIRDAWNLHRVVSSFDLDFFVLNGSVVSLLGTPGHALEVAVNGFCEGLAHHRRALGLPALALSWGQRGSRAGRGIGELSRADVLESFARLLRSSTSHVAPCPIDGQELVEYHPAMAGWPFLADLLAEAPAELSEAALEFMQKLQSATPGARPAIILTTLLAELAEVLRADVAEIDADAPFATLGVDSLMGVELRNRVKTRTGLEIASTSIWTHPTSAGLAEHLATLVPGSPTQAPVTNSVTQAVELGADQVLALDPHDQSLLDELEGLEDLLDV